MEYRFKIVEGTHDAGCIHLGAEGQYLIFSEDPKLLPTWPLYQCKKCNCTWILRKMLSRTDLSEIWIVQPATPIEIRRHWTKEFQDAGRSFYNAHRGLSIQEMNDLKFKK